MKQETKRLSSIILAALIIAAALVVYFEFIIPAYTNLELVKGQEESETTLYANEYQIVNQGKALLATYASEASSTQSVNMALPVGQDISGALAQIYGIGANTGITIQSTAISVQAVQETTPVAASGAANGQIANAAAAGSVLKPTGTISFEVNGSGSYEAFKNFLRGLETNIRIFDVASISMAPAQIAAAKTQVANPDQFNYTVTVVTYYQAS
jgi:Tfp pilus assembly protein PilO